MKGNAHLEEMGHKGKESNNTTFAACEKDESAKRAHNCSTSFAAFS